MNYIISSLGIFACILVILYTAIRLFLRINNKGYEKKFQETFQYGLDDKTDEAINGYKNIINSAGSTNPVLINTWLLLSKAYQSKGPNYYKQALDAVDSAIRLLENKRVNQEEMYLKQALLYKAQFLIDTGQLKEAAGLIENIGQKYPNDPIIEAKIRKFRSLTTEIKKV